MKKYSREERTEARIRWRKVRGYIAKHFSSKGELIQAESNTKQVFDFCLSEDGDIFFNGKKKKFGL